MPIIVSPSAHCVTVVVTVVVIVCLSRCPIVRHPVPVCPAFGIHVLCPGRVPRPVWQSRLSWCGVVPCPIVVPVLVVPLLLTP